VTGNTFCYSTSISNCSLSLYYFISSYTCIRTIYLKFYRVVVYFVPTHCVWRNSVCRFSKLISIRYLYISYPFDRWCVSFLVEQSYTKSIRLSAPICSCRCTIICLILCTYSVSCFYILPRYIWSNTIVTIYVFPVIFVVRIILIWGIKRVVGYYCIFRRPLLWYYILITLFLEYTNTIRLSSYIIRPCVEITKVIVYLILCIRYVGCKQIVTLRL
jgi:hypothetical protein